MHGQFETFLTPLLGSSVNIIQKFLFETQCNINGKSIKFQRPFFFTWLGSLGLFMPFIYITLFKFDHLKIIFKNIKGFLFLSISTLFNCSAGMIAAYTSLYINYSVGLMLRSSTLVFGALIVVFYLKKPLQRYQVIGVLFTCIAIIIVGLAAMFSGSKTTHKTASSLFVAGVILVRFLSKSLQSISMIIEEYVMKNWGLSPIDISGLSGIWSLLFSTIALTSESIPYTISLLKSSPTAVLLSIASVAVFGIWTIMSLTITKKASALTRMVLDQLSIVFVWVVQLIIYWAVKGTSMEEKYGKAGEAWTPMSWLQLFGFLMMVFGTCVYQGFFEKKDESNSPLLENKGNELL